MMHLHDHTNSVKVPVRKIIYPFELSEQIQLNEQHKRNLTYTIY